MSGMTPPILQKRFVHIAQKILFIFMYLNENASFNGEIEQKILKYNISFDRIKKK